MAVRLASADSNDNSSSSFCCISNTETLSSTPEFCPANVVALQRLSDNLEAVFQSKDFGFFSDARIVVAGGREVGVHRCLLSARSPFFRALFVAAKDKVSKFVLKELAGDLEIGYDSLASVLSYLYSGRVRPLPEGVCACVDEDCSHVACRPAVDFMVEVLYASYTFQIAELVTLYQRHLLDIIDKVAVDDVLIILSVANICDKACGKLLSKCIEVVVKSDLDSVTLEKALDIEIVKVISDSRKNLGLVGPAEMSSPNKHVKRIHRALDSDDVELVRLLLNEEHSTLDDAYALHYAVGFCDSKTTTELLDLGLADVNCRNARGYTVLHVAAMRKDPKIVVSLLTKGSRPSDLTLDGRKAIQISKRLTKSVDYYRSTEEGKASPNDRLCIDILEEAERRDPLLGEASVSLAIAGDDLRSRLLYFESRVSLANILFPAEAKLAMEIAQVDRTSESPLAGTCKLTPGNHNTAVDLNDSPFKIKEEHLARLSALQRTVELGKRFFPRCSRVLDVIMDNDEDLTKNLAFENSEEHIPKKKRFMEIQDMLVEAFSQDKEAHEKTALSPSSSSTSVGGFSAKLRKE